MAKEKKIELVEKPAPFFNPLIVEAGLDEAGRGCLAGPVFAAAVVLPKDFDNAILTDSKLMTEQNRYKLRDIIQKEAIAWGVGFATEGEIDEYNIANASYMAMHRAVQMLEIQPEALLVDGKYYKPYDLLIPYKCFIKGDQKFAAISAASVLAKTYRDDFMKKIAAEYPEYEWEVNKGYPTKRHRQVIAQSGATPYHRMSFRLLPKEDK